MKLAKKLSSNIIARKLSLNPFDQIGGGLAIPTGLVQLLFAQTSTSTGCYYTEEEWDADHTYYLKDKSTPIGDLRDKRLGHCLDFDGVTQYIDLGAPGWDLSSNVLVSVWVKLDDSVGTLFNFFNQNSPYNGFTVTYGWGSGISAGQLGFLSGAWVNSGERIDTGDWIHIVCYADQSTVALYVNGSLANTGAITRTNYTGNLTIAYDSIATRMVNGSLYDARVYFGDAADEAAANIGDIYTFNYFGSPTAHYWLQEEAGSTAYDASGNGNHASITGYVSDMRVADEGVRYSVANEVGQTDEWYEITYSSTGHSGVETDFVGDNEYAAIYAKWPLEGGNNNGGFGISNSQEGVVGYQTAILGVSHNGDIRRVGDFDYGGRLDLQDGDIVAVKRLVDGSFTIEVNGVLEYTGDLDFTGPVKAQANDFNGTITNIYRLEGFTAWEDGSVPLTSDNQLYLPPATGSTTQDALGGTLTYQGRAPMPGLAKYVAWQGNGTDVRVELDSDWNTLLSETNWTFRAAVKGFGTFIGRAGLSDTYFSILDSTQIRIRVAAEYGEATGLSIIENDFNIIEIVRSGNTFTVNVNGTTGSWTATSVGTDSNAMQLFLQNSSYTDQTIGFVEWEIGGVTTTYVPIEGTRNVAKLTSDSSDTKIIYDAVVGGTLETLYSQGDGSWRLPHIENGARWAEQNLLEWSEDFSSSVWNATDRVVEADSTTSPDGTLTADKITGDGSTFIFRTSSTYAFPSPGTFSVYVKYIDAQYVQIGGFTSTWTTQKGAVFDIQNGLVTDTGNGATASIELLSDGWCRCSVTATSGVGTYIFVKVVDSGTFVANSTGTSSVVSVYFWGAQFNEGTTPLPYNRTEANPWSASALIPLDAQGNSPDNNPKNIEPCDHPKGIVLDRTGGIKSPLDYEVGIDVYDHEDYNDQNIETNITKRKYSEFSSDRYAASRDAINNNYFTDLYDPLDGIGYWSVEIDFEVQ
jgi:hypothetical protein